ncbi:excisionase family DNA-binding protein [Streptomyces sp. NPDC000151]|uniref:excisionase family DNA-binding protein n=1 Tax=Streptomyces sp. NPDC000151 TaxID=3154244 RepID=UPI00332C1501
MADRLLTVQEVADRLGTTVRFPRRLIEERRIEYVKIGRHVRIPERVVEAFVTAHTVAPSTRRLRGVA